MKQPEAARNALRDATHLLNLRPDRIEGYLLRSRAYLDTGGASNLARQDLDQANRLFPGNLEVQEALYKLTMDWDIRQDLATTKRIHKLATAAENVIATGYPPPPSFLLLLHQGGSPLI
eukprot:891923-Pyramimonas_sp.AAC.1